MVEDQDRLAVLLHAHTCATSTLPWDECFLDHVADAGALLAAGAGMEDGGLEGYQQGYDAGVRAERARHAALVAAAQAVIDRVDAIDASWGAQPLPVIEALRAALIAEAAPSPALDVERLADAIYRCHFTVRDDEEYRCLDDGDAAAAIARAYEEVPA